MIKSQLIAHLTAQFTDLTAQQVSTSVNKILELMRNTLMEGNRIEIRGFGSFSIRHHKPRNAHNPKTGEKIRTEEKYIPHFKPGKELRERIAGSSSPIQKADETTTE